MADLSTPEGKLVERLRNPGDLHGGWLATMSEAADALSRIAAERDEARGFATFWHGVCQSIAVILGLPEPEPLFAGAVRAKFEAAERERDELKAEVERLREALKPFADNPDDWTVDTVNAARAALAEKGAAT